MQLKRKSKLEKKKEGFLKEVHRRELFSSAISEATIREHQIFSIEEDETRKRLKNPFIEGGGYVLLTPTKKGFSKNSFIIKLDKPRVYKKGKKVKS